MKSVSLPESPDKADFMYHAVVFNLSAWLRLVILQVSLIEPNGGDERNRTVVLKASLWLYPESNPLRPLALLLSFRISCRNRLGMPERLALRLSCRRSRRFLKCSCKYCSNDNCPCVHTTHEHREIQHQHIDAFIHHQSPLSLGRGSM